MTKYFDDLINAIPSHLEKLKKDEEENDLIVDYDEERDDVYILLWKMLWIFDQKGYRILDEKWDGHGIAPNNDNYLCVLNDWGNLIPIHHYLKLNEIEQLAKKIGCETKDIHVHHKDKDKFNNRMNNLDVLHKDDHAKKHGFPDWNTLINYSKEKNNRL